MASGGRTEVRLSAVGTPEVAIGGGTAGAWNHFAFVYDSVAGNIKGYLNGVLATTVTPTANPFQLVSTSNTQTFQIGAWGSSNSHPGMLDDFQIYTRSLSTTEVTGSFNSQVSPVPEPETYAGFATASLALFWLGRRRLQATKAA